mmetsp:Transcript_893/g.3291  ORF Transcript_893/g.3291 Transcript_893/m.3291 type:complete len:325 (-) Transcript_893:36-1010(-)
MRSGVQLLTAQRMIREARRRRAQFVLSVGDNFYSWGVESVRDPAFRAVFEDSFHSDADPAFDAVPWFLALGNHDHRGNAAAQVEYAGRSGRWRMPAQYFRADLALWAQGPPLHLLVLDTTPLVCPRVPADASLEEAVYGHPECELFAWGWEARRLGELATWADYQRMADANAAAADAQLAWLEQELHALQAQDDGGWVLVVGHHAMESASAVHGPIARFAVELRPLLERYGADAYFAGHDHIMQHVHAPGARLHHFVCGGGGFMTGAGALHQVVPRYPNLLHASTTFGFFAASATQSQLDLEFISYRGEVVYNTTIARPTAPVH